MRFCIVAEQLGNNSLRIRFKKDNVKVELGSVILGVAAAKHIPIVTGHNFFNSRI
jgi:hypothetical protein